MKVCLVFPCLKNFGGFDSLGKHSEGIYVNHGLASIAAVLSAKGHLVTLVDLRECKSWDDVQAKFAEADADYYCVYMQTLDFYEAKRCGDIAHDLGKKTIVGGPHPSILPEHVIATTSFDYVFVGEAEVTLPDLLENPQKYERLVVGAHPDLDSLPYEQREIFNLKKVFATKHPFFPSPFLSVIVGRGCPFTCSFCKPGEDKIFGKFRMRSIDHLMGEIEMLKDRYDYAILMIDDDSFTLKPDYVKEFCDRYEKIGCPFITQSRADFIVNHPDLVKRMKEVGLWMFIVGFESGNQRILNLYRKGTTVETNLQAANICKQAGVKLWANFILGAPTETLDEVRDTLRMVKTMNPTHYSPSFYTPVVGTDLYEYCREKGLLLSEDPVDCGSRSPTAPKIKGQDYEELHKLLMRELHGELKYQSWRALGKIKRLLS
ncbi:MAG: B12-binding domain-containing radical SAM protein [Candidatus Bathyarchaeota archaeon]|nr:B12-binding domain-containing radical SAM protein [Candidatus Bathyarchaeota archaeon]